MAYLNLVQLRPPRIAIGLALAAVAVNQVIPVTLHPASPGGGILVGAAGFLLMLRAWWLFRQAGTAVCPTESSMALIVEDVYAFTRNPMYLGITMMIAAPGLATGFGSFYLAACSFAALIDRVFCPYEEQKALAEFGDAFRSYAKSVRRWL